MKAQHIKRSPLAAGQKVQPHVGAYVAFIRSPELSIGAKMVLLCLKTYYSRSTLLCCPSYQTIQTDLGCTRNSISKWLKELESKGVITSYKPSGERYKKYHLLDDDYAVLHRKLALLPVQKRPRNSTHLRTRTSTHLRTVTNSRNQGSAPPPKKIIHLPKTKHATPSA